MRQIAKTLKLNKNLVHRFLIEACEEGDLLWEKGESGGTTNGARIGTTRYACLSRFTIVKYVDYQRWDGTTTGTTTGTTLSSSSKERKERTIMPDSDESVIKKQTRPIKKRESLIEMLKEVDRQKIQEQFPGTDVKGQWSLFQRTVLEGTPKNPTPNPYNWKNLQMAFRNWVESASRRSGNGRPLDDTSNNPAYKPFPKLKKEKPPQIKSERLSGNGDE